MTRKSYLKEWLRINSKLQKLNSFIFILIETINDLPINFEQNELFIMNRRENEKTQFFDNCVFLMEFITYRQTVFWVFLFQIFEEKRFTEHVLHNT